MNNKVSNYLNKAKEIILIVLSFLLPCLLMLFLFKIENIYPFGDKTIMMIDMQSQYISYMRYYKSVLEGNKSMIYTLSKVFGGDFMSIFTYYLASPFNLLIVFFSYDEIPAFFLFTNLLKMSLAGLNMYLLIRLQKEKGNFIDLIFSIGYGLISYNVIYLSNFMWLDGVMILPLVILGIDKMAKKENNIIYPLALGYSLLSSWYIGAMICIFAVFYFIYKYISLDKKFKDRNYFILRFFVFSLIGGLISSCMWVTAFLHLGGTKASFSLPQPIFYNFVMILAGFGQNNYKSVNDICTNYGYMSMFTSIISLIFFQLYFFNKNYSIKERIASFVLFIIYLFFSSFSITYTLLHGGREPSWFPCRYAFIIGFMVCYFGSKETDHLSKTNIFGPILPLITGISSYFILKNLPIEMPSGEKLNYEISMMSLIIYFVVIFLLVCYFIFIRFKPKYNKYVKYALTFIFIPLTCISSFNGARNVLQVNDKQYQTIETYKKDETYLSSVEKIKSLEKEENYRMEMLFNRPGNYNDVDNNPMFYSYNGLSHFSSSENKQIEDYMLKLGFHYNGYFEKYDAGSTASINSFLNIKYLIDNTNNYTNNKPKFINKYPYQELTNNDNDGIKYYTNSLTLPLGFASDIMPYEWFQDNERIGNSMKYYNHFEYQNSIYKSLCGNILNENNEKKDIFYKIQPLSINLSEGVIEELDEAGHKYYTGKKNSTIKIKYLVPQEAYNFNLYFSEMNNNDKLNYVMDYNYLENSYWHKGIKGIKDNNSHVHELTMTFKEDLNHEIINESFYYEDTNILKEYVDEINLQGVNDLVIKKGITSFSYEGSFNLNKNNQQMFFTLPYEKGINIYIDGKKVHTYRTGHIFTGANLENISYGNHKVKITYQDKGLILGIGLSFIGLVGLGFSIVYYNKLENLIFDSKKRKHK